MIHQNTNTQTHAHTRTVRQIMSASSPINSSPTIGGTGLIGGGILMGPGTATAGTSLPLNNPITANKFLSKQEREALVQYTKHFIRKAVQIIVQSRLGDKKPTKSRVYAYNSDWVSKQIYFPNVERGCQRNKWLTFCVPIDDLISLLN